MASKIKVPNSAFSEQQVNIGLDQITLILKFNSRNNAWYLDIKDSSADAEILSGIKVMPMQNLTGRYILDNFPSGNIWCMRQNSVSDPIGRDNLGTDKDYGLWYFSNEEEEELGINGNIQL